MSRPKIVLKRVYDDVADSDGKRILVDRIWPRGISKEQAQLDDWVKDIAPSPDLRRWWDHDPDRMDEFTQRYEQELSDDDHAGAVEKLLELVHNNSRITLVYAAKDETANHARVLQDYLRRHS